MKRLPDLGPRGEGWVALQFVLLLSIALVGLVGGDAWSGTLARITDVAGLALLAGGVVLAAAGLLALGRSLTPLPRPRDGAVMVESGVYAAVRHPIYGGLIVAAFGWGLMVASPLALILAAVLAGFFELKSRREEAWLMEHYPGYVDYMEQTRRFVPGIH